MLSLVVNLENFATISIVFLLVGFMFENLGDLTKKFPAAPEYLSTIYLIQRDYSQVNNARLAERLQVSRSAVSQAVKRLKLLELVEQDKYGLIRLTSKGDILAKSVLRRHYLIEHLLVNILDYPWDMSDHEAKLLQDKISPEFTAHLYERLGRPDRCPHGNPFPGTEAEKTVRTSAALKDVAEGKVVRVLRISEEGEEVEGLLSFCYMKNIRPSEALLVKAVDQKEVRVVRISNNEGLNIPHGYAVYIDVEEVGK